MSIVWPRDTQQGKGAFWQPVRPTVLAIGCPHARSKCPKPSAKAALTAGRVETTAVTKTAFSPLLVTIGSFTLPVLTPSTSR